MKIRCNSKVDSSFWGDFLITLRNSLKLNAKKNQNRFIDLLVHKWEIAIYWFGDGEIEEYIDAAEGEVVKETEKVDTGGG